jgi:hypothetical protein
MCFIIYAFMTGSHKCQIKVCVTEFKHVSTLEGYFQIMYIILLIYQGIFWPIDSTIESLGAKTCGDSLPVNINSIMCTPNITYTVKLEIIT